MQSCMLIILFAFSLLFEACSASHYPYSCNAMRLNSAVISGIGISLHYKDFLHDLADLEYEKKAAAERSKRKSWDDTRHVKNMESASRKFSLESVVANATLMRYEFEQWKERNPEAYEAFLKTVDAYNRAALAKAAGEAFMTAIPTRGASLLQFACGVSLFAGVEYVAGLISDYGADKVAKYCAGEDMIKFASYLKTCEFFFKFISEHGIIGGINRKLATANAASHTRSTTTEKPIVSERRASAQTGSGATKKAETKPAQKEEPKVRVVNSKEDVTKYMDGLLSRKNVLRNCGKTNDGHHYYEVMEKTEYMGQTFKKGDYISLDTLHDEVEWFRGKDLHKGAIDVLTGGLKKKGDPSRRLHVK